MQTDPNTTTAGRRCRRSRSRCSATSRCIGPALFDANIIVYLTYGLIVAVDVALFRTRWGLRTRAVGEHPKAADTVGIKVLRHALPQRAHRRPRSPAWRRVFTDRPARRRSTRTSSSGKGFIALAAVIFGRWSPRGAVAAALLFGFADNLQITLVDHRHAGDDPVALPAMRRTS